MVTGGEAAFAWARCRRSTINVAAATEAGHPALAAQRRRVAAACSRAINADQRGAVERRERTSRVAER
jgi:hypothetical protein